MPFDSYLYDLIIYLDDMKKWTIMKKIGQMTLVVQAFNVTKPLFICFPFDSFNTHNISFISVHAEISSLFFLREGLYNSKND